MKATWFSKAVFFPADNATGLGSGPCWDHSSLYHLAPALVQKKTLKPIKIEQAALKDHTTDTIQSTYAEKAEQPYPISDNEKVFLDQSHLKASFCFFWLGTAAVGTRRAGSCKDTNEGGWSPASQGDSPNPYSSCPTSQ